MFAAVDSENAANAEFMATYRIGVWPTLLMLDPADGKVLGLDEAGIAAGLGSACNSKSMRPSHVLKAMGLTEEQAKGALVLTVGEPTTEEEIDRALAIIPTVVKRVRNVTALTAR